MNLSFVCGVVAASFDKLLQEEQLKQLESIDKDQFLSLLKTHQYGLGLFHDFETVMLEEEIKHKSFLLSMIEKEHLLFHILYLTFDQLFLSNLLKSYHLGIKYQQIVKDLSNFNEEAFESYVIFNHLNQISLDDKSFIDQLIQDTKDLDAKAIDDHVILVLHHQILNKFKKADPYLVNYYELLTTVQNTLLFMRTKVYQLGENYLKVNLLSHGLIQVDTFLLNYSKTNTEISSFFASFFGDDIKEVFNDDKSDTFLSDLANYLRKYMHKALESFQYQIHNLGSIIYYTYKKREEMIRLKNAYYKMMED